MTPAIPPWDILSEVNPSFPGMLLPPPATWTPALASPEASRSFLRSLNVGKLHPILSPTLAAGVKATVGCRLKVRFPELIGKGAVHLQGLDISAHLPYQGNVGRSVSQTWCGSSPHWRSVTKEQWREECTQSKRAWSGDGQITQGLSTGAQRWVWLFCTLTINI